MVPARREGRKPHRLVLALPAKAKGEPPAAGHVVAMPAQLAHLAVGVRRHDTFDLGVGGQFPQRGAVEIDDETDAAVVFAGVAAATAGLRYPRRRRSGTRLLLPQDPVLE